LQQPAKWDEISKNGAEFEAKVTIQKLIGIVASQNCDVTRNTLISFFKIDTFTNVTKYKPPESKADNKRRKYLNLLMEGSDTVAKFKWFYLPESDKVGFDQKMTIDLEILFQIPRKSIEENIKFLRKGRLNERSMAHYQRTIANYFTRYAHDKWHCLTKPELKEYNSLLPAGEEVSPIGEQVG
ncbi:MAG TPA: hypothetical protein VFD45_02035, partial [Patescibacteria group bacterium]|nr:hypothetical protein [Patescibacteria group bacterium]